MAVTFGEQVKQIALSTDVIDNNLLDGITGLIEKYLIDSLKIQNAKIMVSDKLDDGSVGLQRYDLKGLHSEIATPIKHENGSLYGQPALSFEKKKPLWIVSATGRQNLSTCEKFTDLWSRLRSIPKFKIAGETDEPVKTRILVPLKIRRSNRVFGVFILESADYLEITDSAKDELKIIAETISIIFRSHKITSAQQTRTDDAIKSLANILSKPVPTLTKPNLFLAFSERAEKDATDVMVKILKNEFSDKILLINWMDMDQPGNINSQLIDAICNCQYAVCYLSEKNKEGLFVDNRNVIFEAGMFHGRTDEVSDVPSKWIPVREMDSPKPPFDFAQERILMVERNKNGSLKQKIFANKFRDRIQAMLTPS